MILGAGIYALIGPAAGMAGNAVWLAFVISALVALFTALSYAELSSMIPKAGAEYNYVAAALGGMAAFVVGWLIIFSGVLGAATVALGFAGYLASLFAVPKILAAGLLIVVLSAILIYGVRESTYLAAMFTLIEIAGLLIIIVAGVPYLGSVNYFEMPGGYGGLFSAAALVFFAYMGFEEMVKFSEETRSPERIIPRALLFSLAVCTVLYILAALSVVSVVGWQDLSSSGAPFSVVAATAWGPLGSSLLSIIALFATANTVLLMLLASSRISFGMAREGSLPGVLSRVHPILRTPWTAVIAVATGALIFIPAGDIGFVANISNFTLFITFFLVNLSIVILRYTLPDANRPFRVPGSIGRFPILPIFGLGSCVFLLLQLEAAVMVIGTLLTIAGGIIAIFTVRNRVQAGQ